MQIGKIPIVFINYIKLFMSLNVFPIMKMVKEFDNKKFKVLNT